MKKAAQSREVLKLMMGWVDAVPLPLVRTIGTLEVLGALGLIVPPLFDVWPASAVVAAVGVALLQIGATTVYLIRKEADVIGLNAVLFVLATAAALLAPSTF